MPEPSGVPPLPAHVRSKILDARTVSGIPPSSYGVEFGSVGELLRTRVGENGARPWLIFYSDTKGREEYSYGAFFDLVLRTASLLREYGIARGDRIATVAYNHIDTVVQYFAAWLIGAVVVPINVGEDDKRIGYILENSQAKLAFVREEFIHRIHQLRSGLPELTTIIRVSEEPSPDSASPDFHSRIAELQPIPAIADPPSLEDEALIVYTSGTTGPPKGVVLSHYNLLIDARAIMEWHRLGSDQRMMCVLPIHHVNGTVVTLMAPLIAGGSVVLNQKFHTGKFFQRIAAERVRVVSVVPTLLQFLLHDNPDISGLDLRHFRHIICGAGPLTVELALEFERRFQIPIIHGYGLSETTCYSCFLPIDLSDSDRRRWLGEFGFPSIGVPLPTNEMAIHDEDGHALPEGEKGEIVIRGHNVMKCYYANPEANEKTFAHGWFRSGDEGFFKRDDLGRQFFFITGRIKELIIRGGVKISPFEIDEVLMNMPGAKAGLAVGFENLWYGEEVGAYVQLQDGKIVSEEEVIGYCRKFFPFQKCPKVVLFGNDIPVTSTGKYQRSRLRPLFERWKEVQFSERKEE